MESPLTTKSPQKWKRCFSHRGESEGGWNPPSPPNALKSGRGKIFSSQKRFERVKEGIWTDTLEFLRL
jgi:hypothetical protein